jgi:hypothetical protein
MENFRRAPSLAAARADLRVNFHSGAPGELYQYFLAVERSQCHFRFECQCVISRVSVALW